MRLSTLAAIKVGNHSWRKQSMKEQRLPTLMELEIPSTLHPLVSTVWSRHDEMEDLWSIVAPGLMQTGGSALRPSKAVKWVWDDPVPTIDYGATMINWVVTIPEFDATDRFEMGVLTGSRDFALSMFQLLSFRVEGITDDPESCVIGNIVADMFIKPPITPTQGTVVSAIAELVTYFPSPPALRLLKTFLHSNLFRRQAHEVWVSCKHDLQDHPFPIHLPGMVCILFEIFTPEQRNMAICDLLTDKMGKTFVTLCRKDFSGEFSTMVLGAADKYH